ncbi:MAG TPA: RDD family protein [Polyangia bacterium]
MPCLTHADPRGPISPAADGQRLFCRCLLPPGSDVDAGVSAGAQGAEPAGRGTRLTAAMLDGLLISVPLLPLLAVGIYYGVRTQMEAVRAGVGEKLSEIPFTGTSELTSELTILLAGAAVIGFLGALGIAIYQWTLIVRTGQSLGKKWTGIRIERIDGSRITFGTGVVLRNWVPKVMGAFPYLGMLFHLVDCLFIFREDRRCLHDLIAGTRVVRHLR